MAEEATSSPAAPQPDPQSNLGSAQPVESAAQRSATHNIESGRVQSSTAGDVHETASELVGKGSAGSSPPAETLSKKRSRTSTSQAVEVGPQSFAAMPLIEQVGFAKLIKTAEEHSVVWCRVKGFPAWPVSVMRLTN